MDDFLKGSFLKNYEDDEIGWDNEMGTDSSLPLDEDDEEEDEGLSMEDLGGYDE
ncbi:hypothetical protein KKB71_01345 [Patescibacteria group bacterium]|nr:hypothetical protein [Patescibacteria group bacterium]MBU2219370.1 hypothetical protein [Patescibacteria group bacterium]MBU2263392.1 hypothetical protein [Patescibacteria group bacterium]